MKIRLMKRLSIIFTLLLLSLSFLYSENFEDYEEPVTLWTEINGVSGYPGFGLGLAPVSTNFQYVRSDVDLFKGAAFMVAGNGIQDVHIGM